METTIKNLKERIREEQIREYLEMCGIPYELRNEVILPKYLQPKK